MEYVKAGSVTLVCTSTETTQNTVSFMATEITEELLPEIKETTSVEISDSIGNVFGKYSNLEFNSITTNADGSVKVTFRIKTELETRLEALEKGQNIQDMAIRELAEIVGDMVNFYIMQIKEGKMDLSEVPEKWRMLVEYEMKDK